jgi:hypothetical protein
MYLPTSATAVRVIFNEIGGARVRIRGRPPLPTRELNPLPELIQARALVAIERAHSPTAAAEKAIEGQNEPSCSSFIEIVLARALEARRHGLELRLKVGCIFDKTNPRDVIYSSRHAADLLPGKESIDSTNGLLCLKTQACVASKRRGDHC